MKQFIRNHITVVSWCFAILGAVVLFFGVKAIDTLLNQEDQVQAIPTVQEENLQSYNEVTHDQIRERVGSAVEIYTNYIQLTPDGKRYQEIDREYTALVESCQRSTSSAYAQPGIGSVKSNMVAYEQQKCAMQKSALEAEKQQLETRLEATYYQGIVDIEKQTCDKSNYSPDNVAYCHSLF